MPIVPILLAAAAVPARVPQGEIVSLGARHEIRGEPCRALPGGFRIIGDPQNWIRPSDYPAEALRSGRQGLVEFTLEVDATGCPSACHITRSSGSTALDDQTCALMIERARFAPARNAQGEAIPMRWSTFIKWVLPNQMPLDQTPWQVHAEATYSEEGRLQSCTSDGDSTRTLIAQFCPFATRIFPSQLAILRKGRTGPFTVLMEGAGRFDGQAAEAMPRDGIVFAKTTLSFAISRGGAISNCQSDDRTPENFAPVLGKACLLLVDSYIPRQDADGKLLPGSGSIAISYTMRVD